MTMTNSSPHQHSATIYQFPLGGRGSVGPRGTQATPVTRAVSHIPAVSGEGWYHDAAIQEAKRPVEH